VCPRCGSAAAVHSIQELAALAQGQLAQQQGYQAGQPGAPGQQQPGWAAEPQAGPLPGQGQQGWAAQPQSGPPSGPGGWRRNTSPVPDTSFGGGDLADIGDDIVGAAMQAGMRFLGGAVARGIGNRFNKALPAMLAKQQELLQTQITIAERHPDIRACLTDHVIFLDGGNRTAPMPNLNTLTVEQADALVAQLRNG
jgi:hypothetical protein